MTIMIYIVDLILLGLLVFMAIRGYIRGFMESVLKSGRLLLSVILTLLLNKPVATLLNDKLINPPVYSMIHGKLSSLADKAEGSAGNLLASIPAALRQQLGDEVTATGSLDHLVEDWSETISQSISGAAAKIVAVILLFVAFMLLLTIVIKLLAGIIKASPLEKVDRILGLALGLLTGVALMLIAARLVAPIMVAVGQGELVESSFILKLIS